MNIYTGVDNSGGVHTFGIKGDSPSQTEMVRINALMDQINKGLP